jgi:DNA-binding GntR family transcriptional regulator
MSIGDLLSGHATLRISDPRQTTLKVHTHLRELVIAGVFPVGMVLKQAELARFFQVSRTPMREAFRMLQEEGLLSAEPNQRSRVTGLPDDELALLYAARIALESLSVRLTAGHLTPDEDRAAVSALREMRHCHQSGDPAGWAVAHRRFHRQMISGGGSAAIRTLNSYTAQTDRYCHTEDFQRHRRQDAAILRAVRAADAGQAAELTARHLADLARRTGHTEAIGTALRMVTGMTGKWISLIGM